MKRKRISLFLALAIALTMILGSLNAAYAQETGTKSNPADIAIIKKLTVVGGVNPPDADFEFKVTPKTVNGAPYAAPNMPQINGNGIVNIHISGTDYDAYRKSSPYAYYTKFSDKLFKNVSWPGPGTYVYEVTETADTYTLKTDNPNINEVMRYSKAVYNITVVVAADGGTNFVQNIIVDRKVDDKGDGSVIEKSDLLFENTFGKNSKYNSFLVAKMVEGDMGDEDKYFEFKFTLNVPDELRHEFYTNEYYEAQVRQYMDLGFGYQLGNLTSAANYKGELFPSSTGGTPCIRIYPGQEVTFYLKHNQELQIPFYAPIGADYVVTEIDPVDYLPHYKVITGGKNFIEGPWGPLVTGKESESLSTGRQLIGEGANGVEFKNTNDDIIITGLRMKDMPFIGMIVLAICVFIGFAVIKTRRKRSSYN